MTIETRVGLIQLTDNRFLGASVFEELSQRYVSPIDAFLAAFGVTSPSDDDREALRLVSLALTSPDARVWPLKLCRLLASYGSPLVGVFASQVVLTSPMMGPNTIAMSARGLAWIAAQVRAGEALPAALDAWRAECRGRMPGFGVPFRAQDERLVALRRFVAGTPLAERPYWRLMEELLAVTAGGPAAPNIAIGVAAVLLDVGVAPDRVGLLGAQIMQPVYVAHALEAAETDRKVLPHLPPEVIDDQSAPPRQIGQPSAPAAGDAWGVPAGLRRAGARGASPAASSQGSTPAEPAVTTYADAGR